jgi:Phage integrase family
MEVLIIGFICFEVAVRGLSPLSTCTVYLPGIANQFAIDDIPSHFSQALKLRRVQLVSKGFLNRYNRDNPKCGRAKVAFILDMTEGVFWVRSGVLASVLYLAMRFGIYFLLRKSEFLYVSGKSSSGIRRRNVEFYTAEHRLIPYGLIGHPLCVAQSVRIRVTFSKTDQSGYGRLLEHVRQKDSNGPCIVKELEKYVAYTRVKWKRGEGDYLFVNQDGSPLYSTSVGSCMKDIALYLGMEASKISLHSLRYGGASLLASFGLPQYIIAYYGGWKDDSEALRLYARPSAGSMALVSDCFAKGRASGEVKAKITAAFGRSPLAEGESWVRG